MKVLSKAGVALAVLGLGILSGGWLLAAKAKPAGLNVGDKAPEFVSTDDQGKPWKSSDHVGKKIVVVYFYPADCTGGCTNQARAFRDDFKKLEDKGVEVVGVSGDSAKNHQVFKKVEKLPFTLLADEEGALARQFGVPFGAGGTFTKKIDGENVQLKRGVTIKRWTFVIGKDGKIVYKDTNVSPAQDSKKILKLVEKLDK
jgi:peroxiredoxin Q/BCP